MPRLGINRSTTRFEMTLSSWMATNRNRVKYNYDNFKKKKKKKDARGQSVQESKVKTIWGGLF